MRVFFYVKIYAFLSVSINHIEYFKGKEDVKICRVSENIFCLWLMEPVELELYIQQLKEAFRKKRGGRESAIFFLDRCNIQ